VTRTARQPAHARGVLAQYDSMSPPDGPYACICATYIVVIVFEHNKLQVYATKTPQLEIYACSQHAIVPLPLLCESSHARCSLVLTTTSFSFFFAQRHGFRSYETIPQQKTKLPPIAQLPASVKNTTRLKKRRS
jgi:hypothetical protein